MYTSIRGPFDTCGQRYYLISTQSVKRRATQSVDAYLSGFGIWELQHVNEQNCMPQKDKGDHTSLFTHPVRFWVYQKHVGHELFWLVRLYLQSLENVEKSQAIHRNVPSARV